MILGNILFPEGPVLARRRGGAPSGAPANVEERRPDPRSPREPRRCGRCRAPASLGSRSEPGLPYPRPSGAPVGGLLTVDVWSVVG